MLINSGFPIEEKKKGGYTPLLLATKDMTLRNVTEKLLKRGAKINVKSETGQTPLAHAIINNDLNLADMLLKYGANIFNEERKYVDVSPFFIAINA